MNAKILKARKKKSMHKKISKNKIKIKKNIEMKTKQEKDIVRNIMKKYQDSFPKSQKEQQDEKTITKYMARHVLFWNIQSFQYSKFTEFKNLQKWLEYQQYNVIKTIKESGVEKEVQEHLNMLATGGMGKPIVEEAKEAVEEAKEAVEETKEAVEEAKEAVEETKEAVEETKEAVEEAKEVVSEPDNNNE